MLCKALRFCTEGRLCKPCLWYILHRKPGEENLVPRLSTHGSDCPASVSPMFAHCGKNIHPFWDGGPSIYLIIILPFSHGFTRELYVYWLFISVYGYVILCLGSACAILVQKPSPNTTSRIGSAKTRGHKQEFVQLQQGKEVQACIPDTQEAEVGRGSGEYKFETYLVYTASPTSVTTQKLCFKIKRDENVAQ